MVWTLIVTAALLVAGCGAPQESSQKPNGTDVNGPTEPEQPLVADATAGPKAASPSPARTYDIPRFAINSPFDTKYESPVPEKGKRIWAGSYLWEKAPDFVVEKWLTDEPDIEGRYVLIEFWATWCGQCKLAVPKLNQLHRKFGKDLVVIGISDEKEEVVRKLEEPNIEYYVAIDTQAGMKGKIGVFGIPHVIIVEPDGYVVWEGFPLLKGYELTEEIVEKILEVGAKRRAGVSSIR
jgi:thiol-disulfide isomerase/thioredoxin